MHAAIPALNHQIAPGSVWCNHDCRALCVNTNPWYRWATYKNRPNATKQFSTVKYEHMLSKLSNINVCGDGDFGWNSESVHQLCDLCGGWISTNLFYLYMRKSTFSSEIPWFTRNAMPFSHSAFCNCIATRFTTDFFGNSSVPVFFFDKKESKTEKTKENRLIINFMKP